MFKGTAAFSGYSVNDMDQAETFYKDVLGLQVTRDWMGLQLAFDNGHRIFIYQKDDHVPATFTVLNFETNAINDVVDALTAAGVVMERYDSMPGGQDERGIMRGKAANQGPDIAWFKDPAGNILGVVEG